MTSIPISKEFGINPALTVCPRCGVETSELVLAGASNKYECADCGRIHLAYSGKAYRLVCPCGNTMRLGGRFDRVGKFDGSAEKVLSTQPCEKCCEELEEHRKIVAEGGIFWKCDTCGKDGASFRNMGLDESFDKT